MHVKRNWGGKIIATMQYNNPVKMKILTFLLIILPLGLGVGEVLSPRPLELTQKLAQVSKARASEDFSVELNGMELILEYEPWRGSQWQRIGRLYLDTHQPGRAVAAFEQAESLGALDAQGFLWLADALLQNGEKQASINVLNGFRTTDSFLLNQAAALLRQADELQQAEEKIRLAYEVDPLDPEINYQLGLMLLAEDPVAARNAFAISQKEEGRSAAARYLSEVIDLYYDQEINADWLITAGKALEQVGEWDVAVKTFRSAVLADPQNALAFALLGFAQQHTGEDGLAALQQALTMDTEGEMPNAMLGIYYHQQGELEEAFVLLQKAADANPKAAAWRIEMGSVLADMGRLDEALTQYEAAAAINEQDPQPWVALAKFSLTRNFHVQDVGLKAVRRALLLKEDDPVTLDLAGTAYMILGDFDSAERFFNEALQKDPGEAAILIHLGQLYLQKGDQEKAFGILRQAAEQAEDVRLKEMAERLLFENGAP